MKVDLSAVRINRGWHYYRLLLGVMYVTIRSKNRILECTNVVCIGRFMPLIDEFVSSNRWVEKNTWDKCLHVLGIDVGWWNVYSVQFVFTVKNIQPIPRNGISQWRRIHYHMKQTPPSKKISSWGLFRRDALLHSLTHWPLGDLNAILEL